MLQNFVIFFFLQFCYFYVYIFTIGIRAISF